MTGAASHWLESIAQDVRYAVRSMVRDRAATIVAVATLAVAIGVNAAVFTVTNAVLFKGFAGVLRNDRLLYISDGGCCVAYPDFEDYRAQAKSFQSMAIVHGIGSIYSDSIGGTENLAVNENSADVFRIVGAQPILGRDFVAADEVDGAPAVGILNYDFWERRYAKDPDVIGRVVKKNGAPMTIVGVMPQGFSFPQRVDLWVPLVKTPFVMDRGNRQTWCVVGRLADDATVDVARAEIETVAKRLALQYPRTNADFKPVVARFHEFFIGPNAALIYGSMWAAVCFVLLIACANLANLLLARAIDRARDVSISIALGADRRRVVQRVLIESIMLSCAGGVLGWWVAKWAVHTYALAMSAKSSWVIIDYTMDQRVLWYQIAISVGTGLLFGLVPALRISQLDVNAILKDGARGATSGRHRNLSAVLVTTEMALAFVLLAGAGVMIRSYLKIHSADMGIDLTGVVGVSVSLGADKYPRPEDRTQFFDGLRARLEALPGVQQVATTDALPSWGSARRSYEMQDAASQEPKQKLSTLGISPAYFRAFRVPLLAGREFAEADSASSAPVAIVNQLFARQFWPGEDPIGKRLRAFDDNTAGPWITVVGVAANVVQNDQSRQRIDPVLYRPYRQSATAESWVVLRAAASSAGLVTAFRREVLALDPDLPLYGPMPIAERLEGFWDTRFYGSLFAAFAGIALLLAAVGLYTVVAHSVGQRTQEIGVRMAIGAQTHHIAALVCRQGLVPCCVGLGIGLAASLAVNRVLAAMLVQVSASDPLTLTIAAAALAGSALLGCLVPTYRAMRQSPVAALRHD